MTAEFWLGMAWGVLILSALVLVGIGLEMRRSAKERVRRAARNRPRITPEQIAAVGERVMRDMRARGELGPVWKETVTHFPLAFSSKPM